MISIKEGVYTQQQMKDLLNIQRIDNIKRNLTNQGYKYRIEGRGKKAIFHIEETPSDFRFFAITELGFGTSTDFNLLKKFLNIYLFEEIMNKEGQIIPFKDLMEVEMVDIMINIFNIKISLDNINRWLKKIEELGLFTSSATEFTYYSTVPRVLESEDRLVIEITEQQYKDSWKAYWRVYNKTRNYEEAFNAMRKITECGRPYKIPKKFFNIFNKDLYDKIISYF